ncbi:hypothetical protein A2U01_0042762, partial [Trifolium medium]|nr:hypothetical protein [Trifolium medium]
MRAESGEEEFSEYDFVITAKSTVKSEYKKYRYPLIKEKCPPLQSVKWQRIILDE